MRCWGGRQDGRVQGGPAEGRSSEATTKNPSFVGRVLWHRWLYKEREREGGNYKQYRLEVRHFHDTPPLPLPSSTSYSGQSGQALTHWAVGQAFRVSQLSYGHHSVKQKLLVWAASEGNCCWWWTATSVPIVAGGDQGMEVRAKFDYWRGGIIMTWTQGRQHMRRGGEGQGSRWGVVGYGTKTGHSGGTL